MKDPAEATGSRTANLMAIVRSSLESVRALLAGGGQTEETRLQIRQLELLEQLLLDQDARLGSFDRILEEFNYSVAHELCAPLRRICGFTREIKLRCGQQLDEEGLACLDQILESTQQMNELIDALMQISRLSHVDLQKGALDLSEMAQELTKELFRETPERGAVFAIQPHLRAVADPVLIKVALGKLLDNAWRFSRHQQPAIIEVGALELEEGTAFFVRDNGVGFAQDQAGRLFHPFQRLHESAGCVGCGMGLTTVKEIVERHGGRVWAEGKRGKGAIFFFTLPG